MTSSVSNRSTPLPVVILISGTGTNLQAIIDSVERDALPIEIRAVISNRPRAAGLQRATRAGIPTNVVDHNRYSDRHSFDRALRETIDAYQPELVVLAGFMRILTPEFVAHYAGRMINIHPALLPAYPGLNTHERALAAGEREHGASVHFVTGEVDGGPVIVQARVPVLPDDTPETLAARVLQQEHIIFPLAIRWFAQGRVEMRGEKAYFDNKPIPPGGIRVEEPDDN
jgi:phosphoribosylglycinamide formyltransferase-1